MARKIIWNKNLLEYLTGNKTHLPPCPLPQSTLHPKVPSQALHSPMQSTLLTHARTNYPTCLWPARDYKVFMNSLKGTPPYKVFMGSGVMWGKFVSIWAYLLFWFGLSPSDATGYATFTGLSVPCTLSKPFTTNNLHSLCRKTRHFSSSLQAQDVGFCTPYVVLHNT